MVLTWHPREGDLQTKKMSFRPRYTLPGRGVMRARSGMMNFRRAYVVPAAQLRTPTKKSRTEPGLDTMDGRMGGYHIREALQSSVTSSCSGAYGKAGRGEEEDGKGHHLYWKVTCLLFCWVPTLQGGKTS